MACPVAFLALTFSLPFASVDSYHMDFTLNQASCLRAFVPLVPLLALLVWHLDHLCLIAPSTGRTTFGNTWHLPAGRNGAFKSNLFLPQVHPSINLGSFNLSFLMIQSEVMSSHPSFPLTISPICSYLQFAIDCYLSKSGTLTVIR